jgi:hypothetical protein
VAEPPAGLSDAQKRALYEDGYVQLPGAVARPVFERALRAINGSLGSEGIAREALPRFRAQTFAPELVRSDDIRALYTASALPQLVASAIGPGKVPPPGEGQIALRFPGVGDGGAGARAWPHIDGIPSALNGVPAGTLYHFTALAGVFLSDTTAPDEGNFTVWPGSHHLMARHLRRHGPGSVIGGYPSLPLPAPVPLIARAGDAVLAHYLLAHGVAPHAGPHVRYAVFFRLTHVDHAHNGERALLEPWLEWEGMSAFSR